jgi:transposase-like protein
VNQRNRHRYRALDTRTGTIDLVIRKLRERQLPPDRLLEPCSRAKHAFVQVWLLPSIASGACRLAESRA